MLKRPVLLAAAYATLSAAAPPTPAAPAPAKPQIGVAIRTEVGTIVLALDAVRAPVTTANFLRYVDQKRFNGATFYRAMHLDWGDQPNGLIQGGIGNDPRRALKPIAHEPTDRTGIVHKAGTISMARFAPGTATGDFSILLSDMPALDANPGAITADGKAGFAAFGRVVSGMDVARRIWDTPRSTTKGDGVMRGQMLEPAVRIVGAARVPVPAVASATAM